MRSYLGEASGVTVTATPHYFGRFLVIRRARDDSRFGGHWAFPGGRVHYFEQNDRSGDSDDRRVLCETLTEAAVREVREETGLRTSGLAFYTDSYDSLGNRAAAHFCIDVEDDHVLVDSDEVMDYRWVSTQEELLKLTPRIAGIEFHLEYIFDELSGRHTGPFRPLSILDLTRAVYSERS